MRRKTAAIWVGICFSTLALVGTAWYLREARIERARLAKEAEVRKEAEDRERENLEKRVRNIERAFEKAKAELDRQEAVDRCRIFHELTKWGVDCDNSRCPHSLYKNRVEKR